MRSTGTLAGPRGDDERPEGSVDLGILCAGGPGRAPITRHGPIQADPIRTITQTVALAEPTGCDARSASLEPIVENYALAQVRAEETMAQHSRFQTAPTVSTPIGRPQNETPTPVRYARASAGR